MPVIAYFDVAEQPQVTLAAFYRGLADIGLFCLARMPLSNFGRRAGRYDRFPELLSELVRREVAVIVYN